MPACHCEARAGGREVHLPKAGKGGGDYGKEFYEPCEDLEKTSDQG